VKLDGYRVVSGSMDKTLRVWNMDTGSCEMILEGHSGSISSVLKLDDCRKLSGSWDKYGI